MGECASPAPARTAGPPAAQSRADGLEEVTSVRWGMGRLEPTPGGVVGVGLILTINLHSHHHVTPQRPQRRTGVWRERKALHPTLISWDAATRSQCRIARDTSLSYSSPNPSACLVGSTPKTCSQCTRFMPSTLPPSSSHRHRFSLQLPANCSPCSTRATSLSP